MASNVTLSGPLFNGVAPRVLKKFCDDWEKDYAQETEEAVRSQGSASFKNSTGNWASHINVSAASDGQEVNDSGIIYGPWLEGTGSRNATTRFKGYATFRKVAQKQNAKSGAHANRLFRSRYLGKIN